MKDKKNTNFLFRNFVSTLTLFAFIVVFITGIFLFVTPAGRIAHWTGWRLAGLTKDQWSAVHICFAITMVIASILHIYLNFKPLVNYFKNCATKKFSFRPEWLTSLVIIIAVYAGTIAEIPPFSSIISLNDHIKYSWDEPGRRAPIPHAETMTLKELSKKASLDVESAIANLKAANIEPASPESVILDLAQEHGMTPERVYRIAIGDKMPINGKSGSGYGGSGRGFGRMTLEQFCETENIDLQKAIETLNSQGISAKSNSTLKELANQSMTTPGQIAEMLRK